MNFISFQHNFCESRLQNNSSPEILNAYSSFIISIIPIIQGIPNNKYLKNVSYLLIFNGFFSFYYHYNLSWLGKHLDEVSMILANYNGICALLSTNVINNKEIYSIFNLLFACLFISFNTLPNYDFLFPYIFGLYSSATIYLVREISLIYNVKKTVDLYLSYSIFGMLAWIISEYYCNEITKYGHLLWHLFFPFGFYKIIKIYDSLI